MDGELSYCLQSFEVDGALIAQRGVPPREIVEAFDVVEDVGTRIVPGTVRLPMAPFDLQGGEEALHDGIVVAVGGAAHAGLNGPALEHGLVDGAGVLAA